MPLYHRNRNHPEIWEECAHDPCSLHSGDIRADDIESLYDKVAQAETLGLSVEEYDDIYSSESSYHTPPKTHKKNRPMFKATYKKSRVKVTRGQKKWHSSQLSSDQTLKLLHTLVRMHKIHHGNLTTSQHLHHKIARGELTVPRQAIQSALVGFPSTLIEYNETMTPQGKRHRVLVRTQESYPIVESGRVQRGNLCAVIELESYQVITAYWNEENDNHKDINMSRYMPNPPQFDF